MQNPAKMSVTMALSHKQRENFRPELELILCCARTRLDESATKKIHGLLQGQLSWSDVMATALGHHVESLLYDNLAVTGNKFFPATWLETMQDILRKASGTSLLLSSEFLRVQKIFDSDELPLIPYKGPALAWLAYQNVTRRRFVDLDFFIEQQNIPHATALLKSAGFRADFGPREEAAGRTGIVPGQYGFYRDATRTAVELHTERTLRYFPIPLDFDKLKQRLLTVEIAGSRVRTFSIEDTLILLCVHGAKHFWERLDWVVDVAELVRAQPVDWPLTLRIAKKLRSRRLLLLGLHLSHELVGASVPQDVLEEAQRDSHVRWLTNRVYDELAGREDPRAGVIPRAVFRLRSRDGAMDAIRHTVRLATNPTMSDRQKTRLPRALSPLYKIVRPWKLVRQYGIGLRGRIEPDLAGYLPMRPEIVDYMLKFAGVQQDDVLYDLGCGDGRITVSAAENFGIRAVGVDIDPRRIAQAKANARKHRVRDRVKFLLMDATKVDLSEATLVTIYLEARGNIRLADTLRSQLRPGARIVSCDAEIFGWPCDERIEHQSEGGEVTRLYLWRIRGQAETHLN